MLNKSQTADVNLNTPTFGSTLTEVCFDTMISYECEKVHLLLSETI